MKKIKCLTAFFALSSATIVTPMASSCSNAKCDKNNTSNINKSMTNASTLNKQGVSKVTFSAGTTGATLSGTTVVEIKNDRKFGSIDKPIATLEEHEFDYWQYSNGQKVEDKDKISSDITITPVFKEAPKTFCVSLYAGDGHFSDGQKVHYFEKKSKTTIAKLLEELSLTIEIDDDNYFYNNTWTDGKDPYSEATEINTSIALYAKYDSVYADTVTGTAFGCKIMEPTKLYVNNVNGNKPDLFYSYDGKDSWTELPTSSSSALDLAKNSIIYLRGNNPSGFSKVEETADVYSSIVFDGGKVTINGNVMGLLDNGENTTSVIPNEGCFNALFKNCTGLWKINSSFLPSKQLTNKCYANMFSDCQNLVNAPELPSDTLTDDCYANMFYNCKNLKNCPELPSYDLTYECYKEMFYGCSSITKIPEFRFITTAENCCTGMFQNCSSITSITSKLRPTTLSKNCYASMFSGCNQLQSIPANLLLAGKDNVGALAEGCYESMFNECNSLVELPEGLLPATSLANKCYADMFSYCESLETIPENILPAETLASQCYEHMFIGCTKLNTKITLPATTAADYCYHSMFNGCTSLSTPATIKLATLASGCCKEMFKECSNLSINNTGLKGTSFFTCPIEIPSEAVENMFNGTIGEYSSDPESQDVYFYGDEEIQPVNFLTCGWNEINGWCEKLEKDGDTEAFCAHFLNGTTAITSMDQFVGLERKVLVNNQLHKVRVVGTCSDNESTYQVNYLTDGTTKVALTFEFENVISDSNGYGLGFQWQDQESTSSCSENYIKSTLRHTLNGTGDAETFSLACERSATSFSDTYKNKTILSMLPSNLQKYIKETKHVVATTTSTWSSGVTTDDPYSDKLFLPNYQNLTKTTSTYCKETKPKPYKYYYSGSSVAKRDVYTDTVQKAQTVSSSIPSDSGQLYSSSVYNYAGWSIKDTSTSVIGTYQWISSPTSWSYSFPMCIEGSSIVAKYSAPISLYGCNFAISIAPMFCI